jgi:predicted ArsR family transcriptional regulator
MVLRSSSAIESDSLAGQIASLATLDDPIRAAIFFLVARSEDPVTRDQAAKALEITRRTAAFHLDKLADAGLVDVSFKRLTGRTGPGAGRSSKLYRRSGRRFNVAVPARNYELLARLLASVIQQETQGVSAAVLLEPQARTFGVTEGAAARKEANPRPSRKQLLAVLVDELTRLGFEPFADGGGTLRLRNCPYHEMARENTDFVCSMNLALMRGVIEGLSVAGVSSALEPSEGMCCVAFHTRSSTANQADAAART